MPKQGIRWEGRIMIKDGSDNHHSPGDSNDVDNGLPSCPHCAGDQPPRFSYKQFAGIAVLLLAGYFILNRLGVFQALPQVSASMTYGMLLLVGVLTSVHCVAMCGGICISQGVQSSEAVGWRARVGPVIIYNFGRVIAYTFVGGLAGALGGVIGFSGGAKGLVAVIAGFFMILIGLNLLGLFPALQRFVPRLPAALRQRTVKLSRGHGALMIGLASGLMPCGPLQAMQIYALGTGSFATGALSMFLFSLGTVPLMLGLGAASGFLSSKFNARMIQVGGILVIVLGVAMLGRGAALSNLWPGNLIATAQSISASAVTATIEGDIQVVESQLTASGYPELVVQAGIPVRWNLQAEAAAINGCNATLVIPSYNIERTLVPGDNIIEFVPEASGVVPYSCWMGMIRSQINVVGDLTSVSLSGPVKTDAGSGGLGCACCTQ
jgi:sulfite exporter TauE/SafE